MSKINVAILGATGSVGQKFLELLSNHPLFEVAELAASERSAGKKYKDATNWIMQTLLRPDFAEMIVKDCKPNLDSKIVFSALDASVAGEIEEDFAKAGYIVISNARNHRYDANVPLMIPEVNPEHLEMIKFQNYGSGAIITNPNCSTIGMVMALKPLNDKFGIESLNVVTMQAISGAGYPGLPGMDILDNAIPFIGGEEPKMEKEPLKILGKLNSSGEVDFADFKISAQCNRVAVNDGHLECVQVKLKNKTSVDEIIETWNSFSAEPQKLNLPSAPKQPIYYFNEDKFPQPKIHRNLENGMAVSVGRLRECPLFDYKFVVLSHNTVRGAAGGTILIAELLHAKGYIS
ncbi:MAG: aspartate-semialdehyde dehydrogenase [bacterium]